MQTENGTTTSTAAAQPAASQPTRSLVRKLAGVMGDVERVPKSGYNDHHRYSYATEADISAAVRKGMSDRGLMLFPDVKKTEWDELPTRNGKMKLCTLTVHFTVEDGDSGETRTFEIIGQGSDNGDKASYKALTGATKYAMLKLFLIPTGDDPETQTAPASQQQQPKQAAAPKPPEAPKAATPPATPCDHEWDLKGKCSKCSAPEPKAEQPKELKDRTSKLWLKAKSAGWAVDAFQGWCAKQLEHTKPSNLWSADEIARLEVAMIEALSDKTEEKMEVGQDG